MFQERGDRFHLALMLRTRLAMKFAPSTHTQSNASACLLRWVFYRDGRALTCQVDGSGSWYDVSVVPHWNLSASAVERLETPATAFRRHAEIAKELRESGWLVALHTA